MAVRDEPERQSGYRRGAMLLSLGIGLSGVLTYAYFALASHELGEDSYGALTVLWSVLFISVVTLYRPVEQFVSRNVAAAGAAGQRHGSAIRVAAAIQVVLAIAFVVVALALRGPIEDGLLSGDADLYRILILAAPAYAVSFFARGYLAGTGRFGLYGSMLLLESCSRFAMAAVVTVGLLSGGSVIAFGILLAPLMSLTVVPLVAFGRKRRRPSDLSVDLIGEEPESPVAVGTSLGRGGAFVGSAFLVMLSEQALLNAGVLVVAAGFNVAAAGLLFNVMLVARAPQVLFGSVTTSLLPSLSRHWVDRDRDGGAAFRGEVAGTVKAVALFDLALIALVATVGPDLMTLTFGADHSYDRLGLVIVAVGLGFHLAALTLTQAQLARDRAPGAAVCWVTCALGFVIFTALPLLPAVRQAETGYAAAAAVLSLLLYRQYAGGARSRQRRRRQDPGRVPGPRQPERASPPATSMRAEEESVEPTVPSPRPGARVRVVRRSGLAALATVVAITALAAPAAAARPSFDVSPAGTMTPRFGFDRHDYAVRCGPDADRLVVAGAPGWQARIGSGGFRGGDRTVRLRPRSARQVRIAFRNRKNGSRRTFHVRCLPRTFPDYSFHRTAPGGPKLFSIQLYDRWAAIFDRNGAPVWWYRASGEPDNVQVLADGTIAFDPVSRFDLQTGDYEIRTLRGRLLRVIRGANGAAADVHEIQLLPNGNYLIGAQAEYRADATAYGGSASSTVIGVEIQEITPDGDLVSSWSSRDQIGLAETGRWWDQQILDNEPYDIVHWNSAELVGKHRMLLSFRHLDAIYMVNRRSGKIIWKLGGTETPESLDVRGDPHGDYPLGGQHDARVLADGSVTIHDNRTLLGESPRVVRYRVDAAAGTARLVESIEDPEVPSSFCCGSARRLDSGDWLVGWGGNGTVGGYDGEGNRLFSLGLAVGFSYRAIPVPDGAVTMPQLRDAMDAMG